MRVTNQLITGTVTRNLFKKNEQLLETQTKISSGKRINEPSDDPVGMGKVLDSRRILSSVDQYDRNIRHGESWLVQTDASLGDVDQLLIRAKELAVLGATETSNPQMRAAAAEEVESIYDQVMRLGNTKMGNSYIFAGHKTDVAPFTRDSDYNITYGGDQGEIGTVIGEQVDVTVNLNGEDVFMSTVNIFDILRDLRNALQNNDTHAIQDQIELLDEGLNQIISKRAEVGAMLNQLETTENHWADFRVNVTQVLSDSEDVDMYRAVTDLATRETAYKAALAASARIVQPTLIDFLN